MIDEKNLQHERTYIIKELGYIDCDKIGSLEFNEIEIFGYRIGRNQ